VFTLLASCNSNSDFLIEKNRVGQLTNETEIQDLASLFSSDSLVAHLSEGAVGFGGAMMESEDEYLVYSKEGEHLLTVVAENALDSTSLIDRVEIISKTYRTKNDVGIGSTFDQVNLNIQIDRVEKGLTSAILYVDELNATLVIDQKELGMNSLRPGKMLLERIPGDSKFRSFTLWFD
jgi:hypothetical protein